MRLVQNRSPLQQPFAQSPFQSVLNQQQQQKQQQIPPPKPVQQPINSSASVSEQDSSPIECDTCHKMIPFFQYEKHTEDHITEQERRRTEKQKQNEKDEQGDAKVAVKSASKPKVKMDFKNFADILNQSIEQNVLKKQDTLKQQLEECKKFINKFEEDNDDEERKLAIEAGVADALLNILLNREGKYIFPLFVHAFYELVNSHFKIRIIIFQKKPFPALIRMINYSDNAVVVYAIMSISNIILAATHTTESKEPHPYYDAVQECNGISKIYSLFKRNVSNYISQIAARSIASLHRGREITDLAMRREIVAHIVLLILDNEDSKDNAKQALSDLSRNPANLAEIMKNVDFEKISKDLQQPLAGSDQEKKAMIKQLECKCRIIYSLFKSREDDQLRTKAIEAGIVDSFIKLFTSWDLNLITEAIILGFLVFTYPYSYTISKLLYEKKPFPSLIRLFDHKDTDVQRLSFSCIDNILYGGAIGTQLTSAHPYYKDLEAAGGIDRLFSMFKRSLSPTILITGAICIGLVFRAREVTDPSRKEIFAFLKKLQNRSESELKTEANLALKCLAANSVNRTEIEKDGFKIPTD
ncbi:MAG: hypothetical protein EZS28_033468 [Streblomastix strix]|uniref:Uncharacterized protein n=1 Tax=Streblomastix strix TaxID=222440 RepID=A0A5J4UMM2_9EUKA|nr:MAG: hypothetical protein EZS28_033468 [Streblomastix strix]